MNKPSYTVVLAGNPNVGKSTIFNSFTGMHQHTGNWTGKTVENARGEYTFNNVRCNIMDLPGTYSLTPRSAEEKAAADYISSGSFDVLVAVLDAVSMQRNLRFACDLLNATDKPVIICLNLIDEAKKKGITINAEKLSEKLCVPVICTSARSGDGMEQLKREIEKALAVGARKGRFDGKPNETAEKIFSECCKADKDSDYSDRRLDKVLLSKRFGIPVMLLMMMVIFWITVVGANYPSQMLSRLFSRLGVWLGNCIDGTRCPRWLNSLITDGVYTTTAWVISVMLPPMAIFFPLFTLLEDSGYLPRIAFNLDSCFCCCGAHGKQALTTAMGFGCNACAVTGCRIIDSPRERLIAIITNSMIPCNGRFPLLIAVTTMFLCSGGEGMVTSLSRAALLSGFVVLSVAASLLASRVLSKTLLKGKPSSFVLELPPYRKPQIGRVIVRSVFDRTIFVLMRAVAVAAPAGAIIWLLANIRLGGVSLITRFTELLDPFAALMGLDGAILAAFFLGFPANEIVLPLTLMIYTGGAVLTELPDFTSLSNVLTLNGWTPLTAVCVIIFSMFHFPCSTTCLTIYKETRSIRWTLIAVLYPLMWGVLLCMLLNMAEYFF